MNGSHERDRSIEWLLRQSLKAPRRGGTDSCIDAETLAAWADGGLSGAALETAQLHVADCARCQALIGALARTEPPVQRPEAAPRRWLAWLVPLAAAATAVAVWVAVPHDRSLPAAPEVPSESADARELNAPLPTSQNEAASAQPPAAGRQEQMSEAKREIGSPERAQTYEARKDAEGRANDRLAPALEAAGKTTASASVDQAPSAQTAARAAASPAPVVAPDATRARSASAFAEATAGSGVLVLSPDPAVRWRLAGSRVEHSTNGGSTWDMVVAGTPAELTAGVAPSASVCWLVGRDGVVLLATDGRSFSRIPFPERTDLSAVRAADAQNASVTTTDGRVFNTTDAGATWLRP